MSSLGRNTVEVQREIFNKNSRMFFVVDIGIAKGAIVVLADYLSYLMEAFIACTH